MKTRNSTPRNVVITRNWRVKGQLTIWLNQLHRNGDFTKVYRRTFKIDNKLDPMVLEARIQLEERKLFNYYAKAIKKVV